ncbi:FliH/SctL family protein [Thiomicrorhabdus sp. 6S3-12]|uniref:FliH/SctL family protein n=1 Tax=Thiomicrorhabdus sp. 6S3-12 TaxID=2819681 RepID=UPI001AAD64EA|nr:FliH/SctL family protein [Thiomicrorhabdus sp. 6S3-12]MBO1924530.1 hypothetical protein [Thiomicrorhabdus sp. 6S3-12]
MSGSHDDAQNAKQLVQPLIQGQLISEEELSAKVPREAITPWSLSDFEEVEQEQEALKQQTIMQEVERKIQPELQKRSEILQKEVYDSAYQEGYEAGFKVGQEEGLATGKSQAYSETREFLFPKIETANRLLQSLQAPQQQMRQKLFDEIVAFSSFLAEQLLNEHLPKNSEWLNQVVQESIQALPESDEAIEVFLNPDDLAFLEEIQPQWGQQWRLSADPKIRPGSCLVKQNDSSVHNCWQKRFVSLQEQLAANAKMLNDQEISAETGEDSLDSMPWDGEAEALPTEEIESESKGSNEGNSEPSAQAADSEVQNWEDEDAARSSGQSANVT